MLIFGVMGFLLGAKIPLGPFVIGLSWPTCGRKASQRIDDDCRRHTVRSSLSHSLLFTILAVILLLWPIIGDWMRSEMHHGNDSITGWAFKNENRPIPFSKISRNQFPHLAGVEAAQLHR